MKTIRKRKKIKVTAPRLTFVFGFIVISLLIVAFCSSRDNILIAFALGVLSVVMGARALELGKRSDEKMAAIANSRFDNAIGVMVDNSEKAEEWMNLFYHTRAGLRLAQWFTKDMKIDFRIQFNKVMEEYKKSDPNLVKELERLRDEYGIDNW